MVHHFGLASVSRTEASATKVVLKGCYCCDVARGYAEQQ